MAGEKLKILLINHSDTAGGASVVSYRLMEALCSLGMDARMLVADKETDSPRVGRAAGNLRRKMSFMAEHADIYLRNGRNRESLFKISTAKYGLPLHKHPWVREADVVILNWINQGMLSLKEIGRIAAMKPVLWTMHDMWNMTGICHYTDRCASELDKGCLSCRMLPSKSTLAHKIFEAKKRLYARGDIHFVAVSHCLAELCRKSPLMTNADITVIPNAFPVERFEPKPILSRIQLELPEGDRLIVMGAARLDDPVKNFPRAIEMLNTASPEGCTAVFFGQIRDKELLESLRIPYVYMGRIDETERLQSLMAHSDVVLSTSVWETLPGTLVEGISCGAVAVSTAFGGQSDIVTPGFSGYFLETDKTNDVSDAEVLMKALSLPQTTEARHERHKDMAERFGARSVAQRYLKLIHSIL